MVELVEEALDVHLHHLLMPVRIRVISPARAAA
jgi:hypothetical protein